MHRVHARRAARMRIDTAFVAPPEPRSIGSTDRGAQFLAGEFLFSGLHVSDPDLVIWDIASTDPLVADEIHGCAWLDDLAALGTAQAEARAKLWVHDWIARYGGGRGHGWTPALTGARLLRWICHGDMLLRGQPAAVRARFFDSLASQLVFLSRRWPVLPAGEARFSALACLVLGGLSLENMGEHVSPAVAALAVDCDAQIGATSGIASRQPEALLHILTLLTWCIEGLQDAEYTVPPALFRAVEHAALILRALRSGDGSLPRFHGGGRGLDGWLDQALASSAIKALPRPEPYMGYVRLGAGRTVVIADAAAPPATPVGHASTSAFTLTSGRRPVVVTCGSAAHLGDKWHRASRGSASHATVVVDERSSALVGTGALRDAPQTVRARVTGDPASAVEISHDGYRADYGLTHSRVLTLSPDGRWLHGEDVLAVLRGADRGVFDARRATFDDHAIRWAARFHLHPDVTAVHQVTSDRVYLHLKSGETWLFAHDGTAKLTLEPSVYLQNGRIKPHPAQQVVLSGGCMAYATRVRWTLSKADDTPDVMRDLAAEAKAGDDV